MGYSKQSPQQLPQGDAGLGGVTTAGRNQICLDRRQQTIASQAVDAPGPSLQSSSTMQCRRGELAGSVVLLFSKLGRLLIKKRKKNYDSETK